VLMPLITEANLPRLVLLRAAKRHAEAGAFEATWDACTSLGLRDFAWSWKTDDLIRDRIGGGAIRIWNHGRTKEEVVALLREVANASTEES